MKPRRSLSERLSSQRALTGLLHTHPDLGIAEMAGMCGYDFIVLDCEHGLFSELELVQTMQVLGSTDTAVMVRLASHDVRAVGRYLDMGADGIVVPDVTSSEQAELLVRAMEYPPGGTRGSGAAAHRSTCYGRDLAEHLKAPRGGASLVVILESERGVANAAEILSVNGVDGALIGPSDLSANLGSPGDYSTAAYTEAMACIERAASAAGKLLGTAPHPGYSLDVLLDRGHRLLILGSDMSLIREAMSAQVAKAKLSF